MKYGKIMRTKNIFKTAAVLMAAQAIAPVAALADNEDLNVEPPDVSVPEVLERVRNYFLGAVIVACVFMILWGAFNYTTSGGDEKKVETAKKTIYYAVIGLIVALLSVAIVSLVMGMDEG